MTIIKADLRDARYSNSMCKNVNFKDCESLTNSLDKSVILVFGRKEEHIETGPLLERSFGGGGEYSYLGEGECSCWPG